MGVELNLVAAMSLNRGIGINGNLPWKLPGDMNFFKKLTTHTPSPDKRNAVLLGRKTWDSIPPRFRPLKGRLNVVVSNTLKLEDTPEVHISSSIEDAVSFISKDPSIHRVFVIGGSTIYQQCLERGYCTRLYLTEINKDIPCDVFFPPFDRHHFQPVKCDEIDDKQHEENGLQYKFVCYHKI